MEIEPLASDDLDVAIRLLAAHDLPTDDLRDPSIALFVARLNGVPVGVVGLQRCADLGLLRSLAVDGATRSAGIGRSLCERVYGAAREHGIASVYLLTTSARDYFVRQGFTVVDRTTVPAAIQQTSQFSSLCPSSAVVMVRRSCSTPGRTS